MSDPEEQSPEDYDRDKVINTLIAEQIQTGKLINEVKLALSSDPEFDGLGVASGIKTVIRRYREEQKKNRQLEKELKQMVQQGKK